MRLMTNLVADGNSDVVDWRGGRGTFVAWGTFDSSTVKLQMSPDAGTTWIDVGDDVTFTADGVGNFDLAVCKLRANVAGGGGSLDVSGAAMVNVQ